MNAVLSKDGYNLEFPIVNIGQFDKKTISTIQREVKRGTLIKYEDFTFPHTKNGYAIAWSSSPEAQALIESLRSLFNGSWVYVPEALQRAEHQIIKRLKELQK